MKTLDRLNFATEVILKYYTKLVEIESALIAFNMNLVHRRTNEIEVLKVKLDKVINEVKKTFESETGASWNKENVDNLCAQNNMLKIAYSNFTGHTDACRQLLKEIRETNEQAHGVAKKYFGNMDEKLQQARVGKWEKKAKR